MIDSSLTSELPKLLSQLLISRECPSVSISGLALSSKKVKRGNAFLAVKGIELDGFSFLMDAKLHGAAVILAEWDGDRKTTSRFEDAEADIGIPVIGVCNLSTLISYIAGYFYSRPSEMIKVMAVTGTNGKTTCAHLYSAMMNEINKVNGNTGRSGYIGTLGLNYFSENEVKEEQSTKLDHPDLTTPDAISIQKHLHEFLSLGYKNVAIEASSHGLSQSRLLDIEIESAVFTNLSRDHLDYHSTLKDYAISKSKLFTEHKIQNAIINIDDDIGREICREIGQKVTILTYSLSNLGADVHCKSISSSSTCLKAEVVTPWGMINVNSRLIGKFNLYNLLAVIAAVMSSGIGKNQENLDLIEDVIPKLSTPPGRMEVISKFDVIGPRVIIDYAHTPDALKNSLSELKSHDVSSVWIVFGCGGDRDQGKRSEMGEIASKYADHVILTNDNPRTESPSKIIADIQKNIKGRVTIELDRAQAIKMAIRSAEKTDTVLISGKGHENYQLIGEKQFFFSDKLQAETILSELEISKSELKGCIA